MVSSVFCQDTRYCLPGVHFFWNLQPIDKVPLAERSRDILKRQAKERQKRKPKSVVENLPPQKDAGKTRDALAKSVGVSGKTYENLVKVVKHG